MSDVPRSLQSWVQLFKRSYSQLTFFNFFYKHTWYQVYFSIPFILSSPFYSLSLLVVTQIRGHIAGSSPPLPTTGRALHFYREKISALSSLVDSRRIVLTHARRSRQLILFSFLQKYSKSRHGGIRTHISIKLVKLKLIPRPRPRTKYAKYSYQVLYAACEDEFRRGPKSHTT